MHHNEVMVLAVDGQCYEKVTGAWMDPTLARTARQEELEELKKHAFYMNVATRSATT